MAVVDPAKRPPKYTVKDNTYYQERVPGSARHVAIEIGDNKEPSKFLPQVKTLHWNNECNFSLRLSDTDPDTAVIDVVNEKVEWSRGDTKVRFYDLNGYEDGGLEFEVEFASKPPSNVITFSIRTKGFRFHKQRPFSDYIIPGEGETVTETEYRSSNDALLEWMPENVVNSYAVYHESKKHNRPDGKHYRTGKAFHIYRPFAVDRNGARVWCDLAIDLRAETLTITVPQAFLDAAEYPILVDPTFGYTTIGGSAAAYRGWCAHLAAPEAGDLTSVSTFIDGAVSPIPTGTRSGINNSDGSVVGTNIAQSSTDSIGSSTYEWIEQNVSASLVGGTDYALINFAKGAANHFYDTGSPDVSYDVSRSLTDFSDSGWSNLSGYDFSIYATYTEGGGGGTDSWPSPLAFLTMGVG